ncbi:MAG TPA: sirohydrochlorin chelatase [Stellaceae bacterium]|jgi:sirohydrochlorin cobaltochelatase|nr:sirohydrochlorin chelatase [Stellaceae bacterium]
MTAGGLKSAVMVCGHGSRDPDAIVEFERVAAGLKAMLPTVDIETGYLEFARPVIRDGLEKLASRGARRILALPGMLFAASHVKNDLPSEINSFAALNPGIELRFGRDLSIEPKLLKVAAARIAEAEGDARRPVARAETLLLVVGRGTSDPDANSNIAKITRMLWEGMGFGWAETAFSGVAHPLVEPGLRRAAMLGFRHIVVFPYFLFTGVLVKRIYAALDRVAADHPEIEFLKAGYLGDHPLVLDCFADRIAEMADGEPAMNCRLCKYREQIIGYETAVGAPQQGHHHHVRGIGTEADHGDHHHHHDGHLHHHGHGSNGA